MRPTVLPLSLALALLPRLAAAEPPSPSPADGIGPVAVKASSSGWTSPAPVREYKNPELRRAGLVLIGLSLGAEVVGGALIGINASHKGSNNLGGVGLVTMMAGGVVLLVGGGVAIAGSVEPTPNEAKLRRPEILVGAGAAGLRWRF